MHLKGTTSGLSLADLSRDIHSPGASSRQARLELTFPGLKFKIAEAIARDQQVRDENKRIGELNPEAKGSLDKEGYGKVAALFKQLMESLGDGRMRNEVSPRTDNKAFAHFEEIHFSEAWAKAATKNSCPIFRPAVLRVMKP